MTTHILTEADFDVFIQDEILPLITRSRNKSGMTGHTSIESQDKSAITSALIFALVGDLGAGKTTFSKKLLHAVGVRQTITSPTFSIINSYDLEDSQDATQFHLVKVFHMDAYRIEDPKELDVLHFDEIISQKKSLIVIEWADLIKEKIPGDAVWIEFEYDTNETRKITIK